MIDVKIKRLSPGAVLPTKAHEHDAGWDFYMPVDAEPLYIFPHKRRLIQTNIALSIPVGWYLQIMSRSGLALQASLDARAGVIDCTYRDNVGIILHNDGDILDRKINPGDKIAQGVFLPVPDVNWEEVDALDETTRGSGGYGSSGR